MFKIIFTRNTKTDNKEVTVTDSVVVRFCHALSKAPTNHRLLTFGVFAAVWGVTYFVLHLEGASKVLEFGVVPFADRAIKALLGEAGE